MGMETATLISNRIEWRCLKPDKVASNRMPAPMKAGIKITNPERDFRCTPWEVT